jgi:hypothetical protein
MAPRDARRVFDVILNLQAVQKRLKLSTAQLLEAVAANFNRHLSGAEKEQALSAWEAARGIIADILNSLGPKNPLLLRAKAEQLAYFKQNILTQARIVTDMRPVFNESGNEILRATITHDLIIDYYSGQNPMRILFALDAADVSELKRLCERAERKADAQTNREPQPTGGFRSRHDVIRIRYSMPQMVGGNFGWIR